VYNFSIHCTPSNRVQVKIAPQYTKIKRGSSVPESTINKREDVTARHLAKLQTQENCFSCRHHKEHHATNTLIKDIPIYCSVRKKRCNPHIARDCKHYQPDMKDYPLDYSHNLSAHPMAMLPEPPAFDPAAACPGTGLGNSPLGISTKLQTVSTQLSSEVSEATNNILPLPRKKIFTRKARETLLDAAGALEKYGIPYDSFYFFTGTLPGSTLEACEAFSRYSRYLLNAFKTYLRKVCGIKYTFNTWEWQLRKKANLTPALHLHLVCVCQDEQMGALLPDILKSEWLRLLDAISHKSGVDLYARAEKLGGGRWSRQQIEANEHTCKTIRCSKSPAAYLSKYVGKGCLASDKDFQARFKKGKLALFYPSSWWSISDSLRDLIKSYTHHYQFQATSVSECYDAYHNFSSILESPDFSLCQLILQPFIPPWDSNRIYQNFYAADSEKYFMIIDLASSYDGRESVFPNHCSQPSYLSQVIDWFKLPENIYHFSRLLRSVPFYARKGDIWDNPQVICNAKKIYFDICNNPGFFSLKENELRCIRFDYERGFFAPPDNDIDSYLDKISRFIDLLGLDEYQEFIKDIPYFEWQDILQPLVYEIYTIP
jgi:hypothetical protein